MSDQNNNQNNNMKEKFEAAVEFCKKNVRYITAAGLFIVIVLVLVKTMGGKTTEPKEVLDTEIATETVAVTETVVQEQLEEDAYPKINELISNYFKYHANGKVKKLKKIAKPITATEKSYIDTFSKFVEKYENISCYTKKGLNEGEYIVFVSLEIKFKDVDTTAPGLEFFYVKSDEDGEFYIDNVYSQFNSANQEKEQDPEIASLIEEFITSEDVVKLQEKVQKKYDKAIASDDKLKELAEVTIPDAITVWASDAAADAKKAEEEAKKAEEEKKAKEEAEKKAKEDQKNAQVVYATEKVNVRKEPNEEAEVLGKLEAGSQTTRFEEKDGWSRIDYSNGTQGYVKSDYLTADKDKVKAQEEAPAEETPAQTDDSLAEGKVITIRESTNIRESMDENSTKIATAFSGEKVTVIMSYAEGWTKVSYGDKTGYIKTELLQ